MTKNRKKYLTEFRNELKVARRNELLLVWLPVRLGIIYSHCIAFYVPAPGRTPPRVPRNSGAHFIAFAAGARKTIHGCTTAHRPRTHVADPCGGGERPPRGPEKYFNVIENASSDRKLIFTFWYSRKHFRHYTECTNITVSGDFAPRPSAGTLPSAHSLGAQPHTSARPPPFPADSPDCLPIPLSISVFSLYSSCCPLLVFRAVD